MREEKKKKEAISTRLTTDEYKRFVRLCKQLKEDKAETLRYCVEQIAEREGVK
jgi:hypothetical protein